MENLKRLRCSRQLTQAELAQEVGVTQSLVAQWERGASMPSAARLPILANVLHCKIDDLFADADSKNPRPGRGRKRGYHETENQKPEYPQ